MPAVYPVLDRIVGQHALDDAINSLTNQAEEVVRNALAPPILQLPDESTYPSIPKHKTFARPPIEAYYWHSANQGGTTTMNVTDPNDPEAGWLHARRHAFEVLTALQLNFKPPVPGLALQYRCAAGNNPPTDWIQGLRFSAPGPLGATPIVGLAFRLVGEAAPYFDLRYRLNIIGDYDFPSVFSAPYTDDSIHMLNSGHGIVGLWLVVVPKV